MLSVEPALEKPKGKIVFLKQTWKFEMGAGCLNILEELRPQAY